MTGRRRAVEGTLKVFQLSRLAWNQVNADDVEAGLGRGVEGELAQVTPGQTAQDAALVFIDGGVGWGGVAGCTGFHFDEAEQAALPGNQVHITGHITGGPAAGNDSVAFAPQSSKSGT